MSRKRLSFPIRFVQFPILPTLLSPHPSKGSITNRDDLKLSFRGLTVSAVLPR